LQIVKTNSSGSFVAKFAVPKSTAAIHLVSAKDISSNAASANFTVVPKILLFPKSSYPGFQDGATGTGFASKSSITINFDGNIVKTITSNALGSFAADWNTPEAKQGWHTITSTDSQGHSASSRVYLL
jgi:hypothetical protein